MPTLAVNLTVRPWLVIAFAAGAACSGGGDASAPSSSATQSPSTEVDGSALAAASGDEPLCNTLFDAGDIPFVAVTFWSSDACPSQRTGLRPMPSSTLTELTREPGKICMTGQVTTGYAELIVDFDGDNRDGTAGTGVRITPEESKGAEPLDAAGLSISQLQFTLETPPASGLAVSLASVVMPGCYGRAECLHAGYYLMSEDRPGVPQRIGEPGVHRLKIADFHAAPWVDPTRELDMTRLGFVAFELSGGEYDFCIRDLKMLDAEGNAISGRR